MGVFGEFQNDHHRERFFQQRDLHRFGGIYAEKCGANTKTGRSCQNAPISDGNGRCLLHCGPKVARLVRDKQIADLAVGRLSLDEWHRLEGKRIMNRLQNSWKKAPWLPGQTIVLGEHEHAFRARCTELGFRLDDLAPAVLDWLRWKFCRLLLDRHEDQKWRHAVLAELPDRIRRAGQKPEGWQSTADYTVMEWAAYRADADSASRKRQMPNRPAMIKAMPLQKRLGPGRPPSSERVRSDMEDLSALFHENRATLGPLFDKCRGVDEQRQLLIALREFKARPEDRAAQTIWLDLVRALMARADCP